MVRKVVAMLLVILLSLTLISCGSKEKTRYEAEFMLLFDTVTQMIGYAETEADFNTYSQLIYDNLKEYHELFDIYHDYEGINNIKTINDQAGIAPVKVDQRIIDLLIFSKEAYLLTNGKTNIAFGAVLKIWHEYREDGIANPEQAKLPPMELLQAAVVHTDINHMIIDEEALTVYLSDPEMSLDVGAIAKGYATEQVSRIAQENGFTGLLSVGGNVRATGFKGDGKELWTVGIQNPDTASEQTNLYLLSMTDKSLVTSGDYERYYTVDGVRYHHIIDPKTLYPANYFTAISIICEDSGRADALSTAVFNMPYEDGIKYIENLPDTEALWVFQDGSVKYSKGFQDLVKE